MRALSSSADRMTQASQVFQSVLILKWTLQRICHAPAAYKTPNILDDEPGKQTCDIHGSGVNSFV